MNIEYRMVIESGGSSRWVSMACRVGRAGAVFLRVVGAINGVGVSKKRADTLTCDESDEYNMSYKSALLNSSIGLSELEAEENEVSSPSAATFLSRLGVIERPRRVCIEGSMPCLQMQGRWAQFLQR